MTRLIRPFALALCLALAATGAAQAACYADYKARRDGPLQLHYGVIELSDAACGDPSRAKQEIQGRIEADGWTLLTVVSTFDQSGLQSRKANAGDFFLRY